MVHRVRWTGRSDPGQSRTRGHLAGPSAGGVVALHGAEAALVTDVDPVGDLAAVDGAGQDEHAGGGQFVTLLAIGGGEPVAGDGAGYLRA